jgi:HAMP domain-containing protein
VPDTPSPNADFVAGDSGGPGGAAHRRAPAESGGPRHIPFLPRTFRGRLAVVISAVVAAALLLVLAVLPRLLDTYFRQQENQDLQARATAVGQLLFQQIRLTQRGGAVPILAPADPLRLSTPLLAALTEVGTPPDERSYLAAVAGAVAQADLEVSFYSGPDPTGEPVASLQAQAPATGIGRTRDPGSVSGTFQVADTYWSQSETTVPVRSVKFTMSRPFTLREQTLANMVTALLVVAISALSLAVIVAFVVADRLTTPLRRLTLASRALAEGRLDARADTPPSWAPEIGELATAFNRMADRLQESIEFIRRDRDRSRDFLADVSHELRTPVAALRTFNELLQDGAVEDPATRQEFQIGRAHV